MSSMKWKVALGGATAAVGLAASHPAYACGAAYPGGPIMCDYPHDKPAEGDESKPQGPPIARVSASYAFTSTTIHFGGLRTDLERHTGFADIQVPLNRAGTLVALAGVGVIAGGDLVHGAAHDTITPGIAANVGIADQVYSGNRYLPFVQLTLTLSYSHMGTETDAAGTRTDGSVSPTGQSSAAFNAGDLRGGLIIGKTFGNVFTPYATGRLFGGPITWTYDGDKVSGGTDAHHWQAGAGFSVALFKRKLDVFAEGIPFGEKGVSAGIGTTFF